MQGRFSHSLLTDFVSSSKISLFLAITASASVKMIMDFALPLFLSNIVGHCALLSRCNCLAKPGRIIHCVDKL